MKAKKDPNIKINKVGNPRRKNKADQRPCKNRFAQPITFTAWAKNKGKSLDKNLLEEPDGN